jgi:hypothetical protein
MKDKIRNMDPSLAHKEESLKHLIEHSTGISLLPIAFGIILPILIVWICGTTLSLCILFGYLLSGALSTYSLSNSLGILANVQDFVIRKTIDHVFRVP